MGAPRGNTNAKNKKSDNPRISVSMGISGQLRTLFTQYLVLAGKNKEGTKEQEQAIKEVAREQAYTHWEHWLSQEIERLQKKNRD